MQIYSFYFENPIAIPYRLNNILRCDKKILKLTEKKFKDMEAILFVGRVTDPGRTGE